MKRFEVVDSLEGLLSYRVVPNFRALGPRVGKSLPRVKELLADVDGGEVRRAFDERGQLRPRRRRRRRDARSRRRRDPRRAARRARARPGRPARGRARPHPRRRPARRRHGAARSAGCSTTSARRTASRSATGSTCATRPTGDLVDGDRTPPRLDRGRSARDRRSSRSTARPPDAAADRDRSTASRSGLRAERCARFSGDCLAAAAEDVAEAGAVVVGVEEASARRWSSSSRGPSGVSSCTASRSVAKNASSSSTSASPPRCRRLDRPRLRRGRGRRRGGCSYARCGGRVSRRPNSACTSTACVDASGPASGLRRRVDADGIGSAYDDGLEYGGCDGGARSAARANGCGVGRRRRRCRGLDATGAGGAAGGDANAGAAAAGARCRRGAKRVGRRRDLDVARLRTRARRRGRTAAQRGEVGLERAHHALAVLGLEARERLDVGEQRVARGSARSTISSSRRRRSDSPRRRASASASATSRRDWISASSTIWRALARGLVHGFVGGALGEQQRAVEDVFGLARVPGLGLRGGEAFAHLLDALVGGLEGRGRAFEQLVDLVAAVAPDGLTNLDVTELAWCDLHAVHCRPALRRIGASPTPPTSGFRGRSASVAQRQICAGR